MYADVMIWEGVILEVGIQDINNCVNAGAWDAPVQWGGRGESQGVFCLGENCIVAKIIYIYIIPGHEASCC